MTIEIEAWVGHHLPLHQKEIKNLENLYTLIHVGRIWTREDEQHDERITIKIETSEE